MEERSNVLSLIIERLNAMLGAKDSMITVLEDEFDVEIPFMQFRRKLTIGESVDYVCELLDE